MTFFSTAPPHKWHRSTAERTATVPSFWFCISTPNRIRLAYAAQAYLFVTVAHCYHPISRHWLTGFLMMSLPAAMAGGLTASVYLLKKRRTVVATAGLVWLCFSLVVARRLVGGGQAPALTQAAPALRVLSFNNEAQPASSEAGRRFSRLEADIVCFQEYSPKTCHVGQYSWKVEKLTSFAPNRRVGLALFSRYPIIKSYGRIWDRNGVPDINGYVWADLRYGMDTIRVVNLHLWSMGVRIEHAAKAAQTGDLPRFFAELANATRRLKAGFTHRTDQIREIETFVTGCRHPVIICGDFNETPMSYSYGKLRQHFKNAFEEAGRGLGFTLNRHPYCVRIDQQFVSSDWVVQKCEVLSHVAFSDHFPVLAEYALKRR